MHQGHEAPLSEGGLEQAKKVAERFRSILIEAIYTSPAYRALGTAEAIHNTTKAKLLTNPLLREIKWPSTIEDRAIRDPEVIKIKEDIMDHWDDPSWRHSDEETFFEARKRIIEFKKFLDAEVRDVAVVSHARTIKLLTGVMLFGNDLSAIVYKDIWKHFRLSLVGLTLFEKGSRGWLMKTWNDYAHLGEDVGEDFYK